MDDREETFDALRALVPLADRADAEGWSKLAAAVRATVDAVEGRLRASELGVVVTGDERAKRMILDVLAGRELFTVDARSASAALVIMRHAERLSYRARMTDGTIEELAQKHPDRTKWLEREIAKAEKELEAAKLRITTLDVELTAKNETLSERRLAVAERLREEPSFGARALGIWVTFVAWILTTLRLRPHPELPPPESRRSPAADGRVVSAMIAQRDIRQAMESAEGELARRQKAVDVLRLEAKQHAEERAKAFAVDVRALTDVNRRGAELDELTLEIPDAALLRGICALDGPARDVRERAGAWILAGGADDDTFAPLVPHVVDPIADDAIFAATLRESLPKILERAKEEAALSVLAIALADMPARMQALAAVTATGETEQKSRIEQLERDRLPEPGKFQEDQLARMTGAIDEAARRVLVRASTRLRERTTALQREWLSAIDACADRASLGATIAELDATAPARVRRLLDGIGDDIGAEMQATSELLQVWVLDEVRQRYETQYLHADKDKDKKALVVAEVPSDEIAAFEEAPLSRVLRRFAVTRIAFAAGSIASGAAIGGAVHAASGAAIGAASGLLAGIVASFVPRTQTMKKACAAALRERMSEIEKASAAWLEGSSANFARDIRAAVDDTLGEALKRRDSSIARLIELEGEAIERERRKLAALMETRAALEENGARFARLAATSAAALREITARR